MRELEFPERHAKTIIAARALGINRIHPSNQQSAISNQTSASSVESQCPLGFIVTGMAAPYLQQVLADIGLSGVFPVLQMGMSYPADVQLVVEFSRLCDKMIVIEERRSFLEKNIRDGLAGELSADDAAELSARLYGKSFPHGLSGIPAVRGLNPSVLAQ